MGPESEREDAPLRQRVVVGGAGSASLKRAAIGDWLDSDPEEAEVSEGGPWVLLFLRLMLCFFVAFFPLDFNKFCLFSR